MASLLTFLIAGHLSWAGAATGAGALDDAWGLLQSTVTRESTVGREHISPHCNDSDQMALRQHFLRVNNSTSDGSKLRALFVETQEGLRHGSGVGIPGLSLSRPTSECSGIQEGSLYSRDRHIACLQATHDISPRCAACTVDFWYNLVFTCFDYCSEKLSTLRCQACSSAAKYRECYVQREPLEVNVPLDAQTR
mmetsp:Transcript_57254/g.167559  ORF Transcript_57254/g.167559 Transcript_57254/m.167559 type:complete len:194 (-) Transcript_57254:50-631(-)